MSFIFAIQYLQRAMESVEPVRRDRARKYEATVAAKNTRALRANSAYAIWFALGRDLPVPENCEVIYVLRSRLTA